MKNISKIVLVAMIVSLFASFAGFAYDYVQQETIDAVTAESIWTDGEFDPEKEITGAQLAGMLERALGVDGKEFIPEFAADKAVTRVALAVTADKAGRTLIENYMNKKVFKELYMDTDALTDEEYQSVANSVYYGFVIPYASKAFEPAKNASCLEAAKAVLTVKSMAKKYEFTVRDVTEKDDPKKFDVYQTGTITQNNGVGGFGMLARFDGAPGEIYVAKSTVEPLLEGQLGNVAPPVTVARVIDPDGNVVARATLDIVKTGKIEKIINIPEGKAGIYAISFSNGREGDLCEVAVNGAKSWGVRGEHSFAYTDTTPKTGYVYIPKMAKHLSLAVDGLEKVITLTAPDGTIYEAELDPRQSTLQAIEIKGPVTDSVYTINMDENFRGFFEIRGVSQLICPTKEMAMDLKGGFIDIEDEYAQWTVATPLQARARAKMVDIYKKAEGNFEVKATKPYEELPAVDELDNVLAETQLFAAYYGSIPSMERVMNGQCLDPKQPLFGMIVGSKFTSGESEYPANSYLSEYYDRSKFGSSAQAFTGALSINSQLNGYYNDPQLKDRVALAQLSCVMHMTQDYDINDSGNPGNDAGSWYLTYTNFKFPHWAESYYAVRKMLDIETREICDTALRLCAERQIGMKGQGPTNQASMNFFGTLAMYEGTGDENFHEFFKRQVDGYLYPLKRPGYHGQAQAGFYIESGGCDGTGYELHNEDYFSRAYLAYFDLDEAKQDPQTKAKLIAASERNLDFMEKFQVGTVEGLDKKYATHFASRTRHGLGGGSAYIANNFLINHMPQARAIWSNEPNPSVATSAAYANSEKTAYANIKKMYGKYGAYYDDASGRENTLSLMYEEMHEPFVEASKLPYQYEGDYNVWDQPGLVALKHKGIYMISFYNNTMPGVKQATKSWHGGGPTFSWIEGLGYTTTSDKPVNYAAMPGTALQSINAINYKPYWTEEEFLASSIVGKDANGEVFVSGKEKPKLTWLEKGKKFEIKGTTPIEGKEISWIYNLTDEGIEITAGVDSVSGKEEFWMQLPIVDQSVKNAEFKVTHKKGKLVTEYRGKKMILTWDENLEYKMHDPKPEDKVRTQMLKIKLPAENPNVTVKMIAE